MKLSLGAQGYAVVITGDVACGPIDFSNDGLFGDVLYIDDVMSVWSGSECSTGNCNDIDFNNDGLFPDVADIGALLRVFAGEGC